MENFKEFIDKALSVGFDKFVALYYPRPESLRDANHLELIRERQRIMGDVELEAAHYRRFDRAMDCVDEWLAEIKKSFGEQNIHYLKLLEDRRSKFDFAFHVLLRGCNWDEAEFNYEWKRQWRKISGGGASERVIGPRIGGLIRHILFNTNCILETNDGNKYRADDFEEFTGIKK